MILIYHAGITAS